MNVDRDADLNSRFEAALAARLRTVNWIADQPGASAAELWTNCEAELGATSPAGGTPAEAAAVLDDHLEVRVANPVPVQKLLPGPPVPPAPPEPNRPVPDPPVPPIEPEPRPVLDPEPF